MARVFIETDKETQDMADALGAKFSLARSAKNFLARGGVTPGGSRASKRGTAK